MDGHKEVMLYSFSLPEIISLVVGVLSVVLGIFAIWLTMYLKKESEELNKETKELLVEIKTDAKSITRGVLSEMEKWGDVGRTVLTSGSDDRRANGMGVEGKDVSVERSRQSGEGVNNG